MSLTQQRLIAVLVVLIVAFGAYKLLLQPAVADRATARDELVTAEQSEVTARSELAVARTAARAVPTNRQTLELLGRVVPREADAARLLDRLDGLAERSEVRLDSLSLAGEGAEAAAPAAPAAGAAAAPAGVERLPVTIELSGTYPRVSRMLRRLNAPPPTFRGERLLDVEQVTLGGEDGEDAAPGRLTVSLTAVAFVTPGGSEAAAGAPGAGATGAPADPAAGTTAAAAPTGTGGAR